MRIRPCIGTTVHLDDAHLTHRQGVLHTQVYHYSHMNSNSMFRIHHEPTYSDGQSLRKELIRLVRCCSDVDDFHRERNLLQSVYPSHEAWTRFVEDNIREFLLEFNSPAWGCLVATQEEYAEFRVRVLEHHQQQIQLKQQREASNMNTLIFNYKAELDSATVDRLKQRLTTVYTECCQNHAEWRETRFKLVPYHSRHVSSNDYLVDRRPPLRLLTLPKAEITRAGQSMTLSRLSKFLFSSLGNDCNDKGDLKFIMKSMSCA